MLSRRSAPVWAAASILVCTHRAYQFWDGGWVKKNDQVASPRDPVEGMGQLQQPEGSRGRPTAFLSDRRTRQEVYTGPDGCVRGCTLTVVACLRIDESRAIRITESHGIPPTLTVCSSMCRVREPSSSSYGPGGILFEYP